eukprot:CAMPEP_0180135704 /NCGR_PEP_ID=MMETSP0986-20121125/11005_1 /TAXON_ID=697907 /ORGANISM="non described non described, Strain CCMP2293" /LENGTH=504 /DNA_ID=CAMNT_0022076485 /DNA_START=36 /DNA_END=1550 /DNA_ORIENTATION=+
MAQRSSYGSIALGDAPGPAPRAGASRSMVLKLAAGGVVAAALGLVAVAMLGGAPAPERSTELMGTWTKPTGIGIDQEPYSAPANLWLYWGSTTNHRFTGSGEHVRHLFKMGTIAGGEYRDPKFVHSIDGGMFNKLSQLCCNALLFPPLEWDFPVYNANKIEAQNLRAFVANGNSLIMTGGIMTLEFINRYFFYNLEESDGNFDAGPFLRLPRYQGLTEKQHDIMEPAPRTLPQIGIEVTAVKKESLPSGSSIVYTSPYNTPVFAIKFCMAENPMNDPNAPLPPSKVLPRDCPASARAGRPCSCGFLCYLGYDWRDSYPSRWDKSLQAMVDMCSEVPVENKDPALLAFLKPKPQGGDEAPSDAPADADAGKAARAASTPAKAEKPEKAGKAAKAAGEEEADEEEKPAPAAGSVVNVNVNVNPSGGAVHFGSKFAKEQEADAPVATTSAKIQVGSDGAVSTQQMREPSSEEEAPAQGASLGMPDPDGGDKGCGPLCKLQRLVGSLE